MNDNSFNRNNEKKKIITLFIMIITLMVCVTGATYAYFAISATATNNITGVAASGNIAFSVTPTLVSPSSSYASLPMVPQYAYNKSKNVLQLAVNGTIAPCVDDNGNVVCKIYTFTVKNNSTAVVDISGTIKFTNPPTNLKWAPMSSATKTVDISSATDSDIHKATTSEVTLYGGTGTDKSWQLAANGGEKQFWIVLWLNETGADQSDVGTWYATLSFTESNGKGITSTITGGASAGGTSQLNEYATSIMVPVAVSDSSIDFSKSSDESNTNGVYVRSGTENDTNPIYYYRGNVNNNLIFADTCWKVVRTTETGGLKLLYNGLPTDGQCNNTGLTTTIGTKLGDLNYMLSARFEDVINVVDVIELGLEQGQLVIGNSITYSNGIYTLNDTITGTWENLYENGFDYHHYLCSTLVETSCESVAYIFITSEDVIAFVILENGVTLNDGYAAIFSNNEKSGRIKGNSTTEGTLDYWYYTNIEQKGYSSYIEDTIWCNDRSVYSLGTFNPNGGSTYLELESFMFDLNTSLLFLPYERMLSATPSLSCNRNVDKFTVSNLIGNGDLDYPVGLLTVDEMMLAGANNQTSTNVTCYLNGGFSYWSMSPHSSMPIDISFAFSGGVGGWDGDMTAGIRPSISLKIGFTLTGNGDGTATNPYVVS